MRQYAIVFSGFVLIFLVSAASTVYGANTVSLPDIAVHPDESGTFALHLADDDTVGSTELHFTYDSTIGFDVIGVSATARTTGYIVAFNKDTSNPSEVEMIVLLYSYGLTISPGAGDILEFDYQTTPNATGSCNLVLTMENLLAAQNASPLPMLTQDGSVSITPQDSLNYLLWTK